VLLSKSRWEGGRRGGGGGGERGGGGGRKGGRSLSGESESAFNTLGVRGGEVVLSERGRRGS